MKIVHSSRYAKELVSCLDGGVVAGLDLRYQIKVRLSGFRLFAEL
jgi:hypothetical protein